MKCDCVDGSVFNGIQQPILKCLAHSSPPGHEIYKEPRIKLLKNLKKSVLSYITFFLEDDDYRPVDFNEESLSFTGQLIKIK